MHTCEHCKATIRQQAKFCPSCGKPVAEGDIPQYTWQIDVPLITNRFILTNTATGLGAALLIFFIILGGIFGFASGWEGVGQALLATLGMGGFRRCLLYQKVAHPYPYSFLAKNSKGL